jgi:putative ABC transport system permease protein
VNAGNIPSWPEVAASGLLVVLAVAIAARQRLGLSRELVAAALRAALQLAAVGAVLLVVLQRTGLPGSLVWVAAMVAIAAHVAGHRGRVLPHARALAAAGIATGTAVSLGMLLALGVISTRPEVIVPVGGMIVSGAMQATGLALLRLADETRTARPQIEARLSLGLSARDAFGPHRRTAARTALLPAIDSTKVVGLISLPGAMTGLILAGVDPLTAIRYQIVVMYMLLAAAALAAVTTSRLAERALFDTAHRLRPLPAFTADRTPVPG